MNVSRTLIVDFVKGNIYLYVMIIDGLYVISFSFLYIHYMM